jgi:hypothetical protein
VPNPDPTDDVLAALDELVTVLRETTDRNRAAIDRANAIRKLRKRGHLYSEIVPMEKRPLIVELLTRSLYELSNASNRFRSFEARELYSEGLTMAEIGDLFGVTRQRIATLIRGSTDGSNGDEAAASQPRRRGPGTGEKRRPSQR